MGAPLEIRAKRRPLRCTMRWRSIKRKEGAIVCRKLWGGGIVQGGRWCRTTVNTGAVRARLHDDAALFWSAAGSFFEADPFSSNVIGVVTERVLSGGRLSPNEGNLWATVEDEVGRVCGLAMHTPPHPLFLSRMPELAAITLAEALADDGRELAGVVGAKLRRQTRSLRCGLARRATGPRS